MVSGWVTWAAWEVARRPVPVLPRRRTGHIHILTPTISATATNEQVKHGIEFGKFGVCIIHRVAGGKRGWKTWCICLVWTSIHVSPLLFWLFKSQQSVQMSTNAQFKRHTIWWFYHDKVAGSRPRTGKHDTWTGGWTRKWICSSPRAVKDGHSSSYPTV